MLVANIADGEALLLSAEGCVRCIGGMCAIMRDGATAEEVRRTGGATTLERAHMADNFAQTVKQQADIVRIVGEYVKLRKAGRRTGRGCVRFTRRSRGRFIVYPATRELLLLWVP